MCGFLPLGRSKSVISRTAYSTLAVIFAFAMAYIALLSHLGYSYELHVASTIVFALCGIAFTSGLFRGGSQGSKALPVRSIFAPLVVLVLLEELLLNSVFATYGLALSFGGLVLLPIFAVVLGRRNSWLRVALEAVALIFGTRVVLSPFLPRFLGLSLFLPTIYTLILVALALYLTYRRIPLSQVRFSTGKRSVRFQLGFGLGVGLVLGFVEYHVLNPQPILAGAGLFQIVVYTVIVLTVMVGVVEELLFRGLLQAALERVIPVWQAIGVSSVIFGLMHTGWMNPLEVLFAYGAGVVFGYLSTTTDSLVAPATAHGFGNLVLYLIAIYRP